MDITTLLLSTLINFWYLIPLFILLIFLKTPFAKGIFGEFLVNFAINVRLDKSKYHLLKNVTLPTEDGTTQVDHIVVSQYGIFVIETKNMKGWIFGSEQQKTWTQKIYKHRTKFQNPLHQNYKHIKTLESLLGIEGDKIFSIITFVGDSTFKTPMPPNVTYGGAFVSYIESKTQKILSKEEVESIIATIENGQLTQSRQTNKAHTQHLKSIIKGKESQNLCPKCGSELVLRVAKRGTNRGNEFYGCSGYPRCRYIAS